jgi:hypothetical protein
MVEKALWAVLGMTLLASCGFTSGTQVQRTMLTSPPTVERPAFIFHRVVAGETMGTIARYYSGKESAWREIADANPGLSPFKLKADEIVKVPVAVATVNQEQPATSTAARKPRKPPTKSGASAADPTELDEEVEENFEPIFGPR